MDLLFNTETVKPWYANQEPWFAAIGTLLLGFGVFLILWRCAEHRRDWPRWKAFMIGDSIGFTVYAWFAAKALKDYQPSGAWYDQKWVTHLLMAIGCYAAILILIHAVEDPKRELTWKKVLVPSEIYHTLVVFPVMTALIGRSFYLTFFVEDVSWSIRTGELAGLAIYAAALLYDFSPLQNHGPGR